MATADQYAQWIVNNADKKGTEDFNTVAQAYKEAKASEARSSQESTSSIPTAIGGAANVFRNNVGAVIPEGMPGQIANKIGQTVGQMTPGQAVRGALDVGLMAHGQAPWASILRAAHENLPEAKNLWNQPIAESMGKYVDAAKALPGQAVTAGKEMLGVAGRGALKMAGPIGAANEVYNAYNQAQQGDYTGAGISAAKGVSLMPSSGPFGVTSLPGLEMMGSANQNFRQQNPQQQYESSMDALSGTAPGQAGEYTSASQPHDEGIKKLIREAAAKKALSLQNQ